MSNQVSHQGEDVRGRNYFVLSRDVPELNVYANIDDQGAAMKAIRFRIG
jgi:hypothetical protein